MEEIRVGIVGFGMMGRMQAACFESAPGFRVAAVCDDHPPSLDAARSFYAGRDVRFYSDHRDMLDQGRLDLAAVVTPDSLHEAIAVACLDSGLHVRVEKPMALDPAGCARVLEAARRSGKVLQVGLELRYAELVSAMRRELAGLGRLKLLWCHEFRHPFLDKGGSVPGWILRKEHENGVRASLSLCMFCPPRGGRENMHSLEIGLIGDEGRLEMRDDELFAWDRKTLSERVFRHERSDLVGHDDEILPSLGDLAACVRSGGRPLADGGAGLDSVIVSCAAELSAAEGRIVTIGEMESRYGVAYDEGEA
jgi:predicted dehydrogenase